MPPYLTERWCEQNPRRRAAAVTGALPKKEGPATGKLCLWHTLARVLPTHLKAERERKITIRQLLEHTAAWRPIEHAQATRG